MLKKLASVDFSTMCYCVCTKKKVGDKKEWPHCHAAVMSEAIHCMCKGMPVILVNRVVDKNLIIGKNGGPRRRGGTRGC
jgi:hypothetical protein